MKKPLFLLFLLVAAIPLVMTAQGTSWQTATLINNGATVSGTLDSDHTEVWYKIEVPQEGHIDFVATATETLKFDHYNSIVYGFKNDNIYSRGSFGSSNGGYNNTITYNAVNVGKGTYYIRIKRYNGSGGYSLKYTFTPCPLANDAEPAVDDYQHATLLQSGKTVTGRMGYVNSEDVLDGEDWYKIDVPQEGHIDFIVTGTEDLKFDHYNSKVYGFKNNDIYSRGNFGSSDSNYNDTITYNAVNVGKGTYYIRIKRYNGSGGYRLKYTFTPCPLANDAEPDADDYQHATLLQSGKTVTGRMGYVSSADVLDHEDWYKIDVPQEGHIDFVVTGTETLKFDHYNSIVYGFRNDNIYSRGNFGSSDSNYNDTITYNRTNVGKGTYYIRIRRYGGSGGYRLKYTFTPCPLANDNEAEGYADAKAILNGQTATGRLGYVNSEDVLDGEDWHKIEITNDGIVRLIVTGTEDLKFDHYNSIVYGFKNDNIYSRGTFGSSDSNYNDTITYEATNVGPGTYYIRIKRYNGSGGYRLHYDFIANNYPNDTEPNDDDEHAIPFEYGTTVKGHLGYRNSADVTDAKDVYKVTLDEFALFRFSTDTASTLSVNRLVLRNQSGKTYSINPGSNGVLMQDDLEPGTYYLEVYRYNGYGGYTISSGTNEPIGGTNIKLSWIGQNSVRLGIPSEYTIKIENTGDETSRLFFLPIACTPDIELIGARLPGNNGYEEYLPMDSIGIPGDSVMWFVVTPLAPHESYSFNIIAKGLVMPRSQNNAPQEIGLVSGSVIVIGGIILYNVAVDYIGDEVIGFCNEVIKDHIDLDEEELDLYQYKDPDVYKKLVEERQQDGVAVKAGKRVVKTLVSQALSVIPGGQGILFAGELIETAAALGKSLYRRLMYTIFKDIGYFHDHEAEWKAKWHGVKVGTNKIVRSWDPNEKVGPVGYGDENYIPQTSSVTYRIMFENKKEATAPAYRIRISDVLDENVFDLTSVHFEGTSHDGIGYNWIMNQDGNTLSWDIEGIELPPNVNAPEGEGYVAFSVNMLPGLENMTEIKNKATIIFDYNEPIETNEFVNTLDLMPPTATMLSAKASGQDVTVKCTGSDGESGIGRYRFYAMLGDEEPMFIGDETEGKIVYTVPDGNNPMDYKFYALAVDNVDNIQETPPTAIGVTAGVNGDVNGDGEVTVADINVIINCILSSHFDSAADVNGDGEITVADINVVINIILT